MSIIEKSAAFVDHLLVQLSLHGACNYQLSQCAFINSA
jgi:imidazoleglycerol phosphate dehydratase HisB